jgi:5-formyltetrahydrofolate cyclo-ligase
MDAKKALRAKALAIRRQAFARYGAAAGERLAAHGLAFCSPPPGAAVSAFLAIGEEIDPLPLMRRLWACGHAVGLPVMIGKGQPLTFRRWQEGEPLGAAMWGIREPLPEAPAIEPDVLAVPLLAFDRAGFRLGYGGGFYDRTLEGLRARKRVIAVGLGYDELEVDDVPHLDYDQPLDWVLTPSGPIKCSVPAR